MGPMLKPSKTSKAYISVTVGDRPMIFFLLGRPRVSLVTLTLTFEVKVISRSNAQNESKVSANMSVVFPDHARVCLSKLVH